MAKPDTRIDEPNADAQERMWPLDVLVTALSGLILYVVVTNLRFDDPRLMHNAWTYVISVPVIAVLLAILLHNLASRYLQKSIQLGFLFSVLVHLLLMMLAIKIVIFSRYFPEATTGVMAERSPIRRTIPEYLFRTPQQRADTPDWSKPTEAETASRIIPKEKRKLPPVEFSKAKLEMPRPLEPEPKQLQTFLMRREQPSSMLPKPADSPGKLARKELRDLNPTATPIESIEVPQATITPSAQADPDQVERELASLGLRTAAPSENRSADPALSTPGESPLQSQTQPDPGPAVDRSNRRIAKSLPMVGDAGMSKSRVRSTRPSAPQPAGAAPSPPTVSIARQDDSSHRLRASAAADLRRQSKTTGAQLAGGQAVGAELKSPTVTPSVADAAMRNRVASLMGQPKIRGASIPQSRTQSASRSPQSAWTPAGAPTASDAIASVGPSRQPDSGSQINDRVESESTMRRRSSDRSRTGVPNVSDFADAEPTFGMGPSIDSVLADGPTGLARRPAPQSGVVPSPDPSPIAAFDLSREKRPRREVGGPTNPAGTKIAAVESFSRRVMRTDSGAAPTPAGMVGPATEEAIERGLVYLANTQREDGSWSLAGHSEPVILESRSAATGLCLLAFQGAGYTHLQHQYANTVSRALEYLIQNQRTNGDLYRQENALSDRNVALYSHGIAALAVCEAYGMTQDPQLREPAQSAINYIAGTQHRRRGGWRYTPQVSSDTSVSGWMMMAIKSGELAGLDVPRQTYAGINKWLDLAKESPNRPDRYRYNPFAPDTPSQRHGRFVTPSMTAVGMLMRMYSGWRRDRPEMKSAADYLLKYPPQIGTPRSPQRDTYYWYYATQVMFHMGGQYWKTWSRYLNPMLLDSQIIDGDNAGSWDPKSPVPDRWSPHAGRLYVTTMNLLNLEVYYRHLPIYEDTAE